MQNQKLKKIVISSSCIRACSVHPFFRWNWLFTAEFCRTQKTFAGILPNALLWNFNSSLSNRTLIFNSSLEFDFHCNYSFFFPAFFRSNSNSSLDIMESEIQENTAEFSSTNSKKNKSKKRQRKSYSNGVGKKKQKKQKNNDSSSAKKTR